MPAQRRLQVAARATSGRATVRGPQDFRGAIHKVNVGLGRQAARAGKLLPIAAISDT
jgi:hypothetical protein